MSLLQLDHDRFVRTALPGSGDVARISLAATKAVAKVEEFEAALPARPSAEQLNELDGLKSRAMATLGEEFFAQLAEQRAERHERMLEALRTLAEDWSAEEADQGLVRWRSRPTSYAPIQSGSLAVAVGPPSNPEIVPGRKLLSLLAGLIRGA